MRKMFFIYVALLMAAPVMAVDFDLYGNLELGIWWDRRERWYDDTNEININTSTNDTDVVWGADSLPVFNSSWVPWGKFGFKLKTDRIAGCFELGISNNIYEMNLSGATGMKILKRENIFLYLRKWYGKFDINDYLSLLIGQDYAPANFLISDQAFYDNNAMTNLGCLYTGRIPSVQLTIAGEIGTGLNLKGRVAALKPDTIIIGFRRNELESEVETRAPKAEARVDVDFETETFGFNAGLMGGFVRYYSLLRADPSIPKDSFRVDVNCYVFGGEATIKAGPVTVSGTFSKSQNPAAYGIASGNRWEWRGSATDPKTKDIYIPFHYFEWDTTITANDTTIEQVWDIRNSDFFQWAVIAKVKPWEFLGFEGGFGWQTVEHEYETYNSYFDDRFVWYFQTLITLFESFHITPEVGQFYWGAEYLQGGRFTYWGIRSVFDF